ncbi:hypothetical protein KR018_008209 [Drosophila ironensis]|nr:hypothetical protein KR018_008209 [Drosophila ironensis]
MAKRFGPLKDFARAKKPRLDVSVTRASSRPSPPRNTMAFWDDDDDDVILMATQVAEAEIEAEERRRRAEMPPPAPQATQSEVTFSEFAPMVQGSTSTQQMPPPPAKKPTTPLDVDAIFADDDDFDFLAVTLMESEPLVSKPVSSTIQTQTRTSSISIHKSSTTTTTSSTALSATQTRQQEHQINFLMERIEALKRDKAKLEKDLGDSNQRNEIRSGEVSLLRDELKHVRQQLQASKMEKLALADATNRDCNQKVAEAAKQIAAKDIELKMKNAEYTKLKIQQKVHERSMNMSMNMSMMQALPSDPAEQRLLLRLNKLNIHRSACHATKGNGSVFEYDEEQQQGQKQRTLFDLELKQLLLHFAQLQAQPDSLDSLIPKILASAGRVFTEFSSYAHGLEFPQNCMLYPYNPYNLDEQVHRESLWQQGNLYEYERAVLLRRYVATLSLLFRYQGKIASAFLDYKHNDLGLLEAAIEAVIKLGFSYEVSEHYGLLEALASLLNSLMLRVEVPPEKYELLFDLLKQLLVFTRPSPWVFGELSSCFLGALRHPQLMTKMCVHSPKKCFVSDRMRKVYRFGPESCLLQVYSGLLELCFFSETPLRPDYLRILLQVAGNHVRFAFICFKNPPDFILEMLPYFADDDEPDTGDSTMMKSGLTAQGSVANGSTLASVSNSNMNCGNSSSNVGECECYVKLCLSVVTLVFQMLHQWMLHQRQAGTEQVGEISRIAVHLLNLVFHEYYLTCLFRDAEETTKHYLSLICNWWSEYADLLGFQSIHWRLLNQLAKSHFMLKPLHQEANPQNPGNDLAEWTRIVRNADAQSNGRPAQKTSPCKLLDIDFFAGLKGVDYTFE